MFQRSPSSASACRLGPCEGNGSTSRAFPAAHFSSANERKPGTCSNSGVSAAVHFSSEKKLKPGTSPSPSLNSASIIDNAGELVEDTWRRFSFQHPLQSRTSIPNPSESATCPEVPEALVASALKEVQPGGAPFASRLHFESRINCWIVMCCSGNCVSAARTPKGARKRAMFPTQGCSRLTASL